MTALYDVCIIGAGMCGSSAAKHIMKLDSSLKVALIGPNEPDDRSKCDIFGAHYDEGRITRYLDTNFSWGLLALRSIKSYRQIEEESGVKFFQDTGYLAISNKGSNYISKIKETVEKLKENVECVNSHEVASRWQYPKFGNDVEGLYAKSNGGYLNPRKLVVAQKVIAQKLGCDIIVDVVDGLNEGENGNLTLSMDGGQVITSKKVLLATGAFSGCRNLLPQNLKPKFELYSTMVLMVEIDKEHIGLVQYMPSCLCVVDSISVDGKQENLSAYILPPIKYPSGKTFIKVGHSNLYNSYFKSHEEMVQWYRNGDNSIIKEALKNVFASYFPDIPMTCCHYDQCVTTHTEHGHIYAEMLRPNLGVLIGGCGQAAKSCDEIGRMGARMVIDGHWDYDLPQDTFKYRTEKQDSTRTQCAQSS